MPISISCTNCTAKFKAPDQAAGRKTKCPKCGGEIQIPAAAPAPAAPPTPPVTRPAAREPIAQAVPQPASAVPNLPPLAQEFSAADFATSASFSSPLATSLPQAQPAPQRRISSVMWIVVGIAGFMLFVAFVIAPIVLKNKDKATIARHEAADRPEPNHAEFEAVMQQVNAEYTIPDSERVTPRPPATLTPRESKLLFVINGDRLGMTVDEFRKKHRHTFKGDSRPSPMMSDNRNHAARRENPLETLAEQPWHVDAKIVHARITWPFEDTANSTFTPTFNGVRATDHRFMFVDEQLWRMQFVFPSSDFAAVQQAVIAQLGQPAATPSKLGLALRGVYPGAILSWSNEFAAADLVEHTLEGDKSLLIIRHLALEKVNDSRRPAK